MTCLAVERKEKQVLVLKECHFYRYKDDCGKERIGRYEGQMVETCYTFMPQCHIDRMVYTFIVLGSSSSFSVIGYPNIPRIMEDLGTEFIVR